MANDQFASRQSAFPDEIGNTLAAFLGGLQKAHHDNLMTEAEFSAFCAAKKNIETKLQAGVIDAEQALTLMQSLPFIEYIDDEGFGLDTAEIEMNMRVSAHQESKSETSGSVSSETSASAGGGFLGMGAKASTKITGTLSHSADQADSADYSAYTNLKVTMKRTKPAPARRLTSELMQEMVRDTHEIVKSVSKVQKSKLSDELLAKDPPKQIPKSEDGGDSGSDDSTSSGTSNDDSSYESAENSE